ncbi:MAG: 5'-deoxynucleotidase [Clostridia bacterium]|nr:5'-deoxynucleotidase [Clostridia bacterium]NCC76403.1 5'-deoxynucleotidase [Clostridia bacterium]
MGRHFFAMLHRMRYINRWGLMRNTQSENITEHSLEVAVIAHALAEIRQANHASGQIPVDPARVALLAIFHDASEILTGDLPTPVKYYNPAIQEAYKKVEATASEQLLKLVPETLQDAYRALLLPDRSDPATDEAMRLVKAADRISALIKCIDEEKAGNREFRRARDTIEASIHAIDLPEVLQFMEQELPSFWQSLDELSNSALP